MKLKKTNLKTTIPDRCSCEEKEANAILKKNYKRLETTQINDSSDYLFAKRFLVSLLKEQEELENAPEEPLQDPNSSAAPEDFTPEKNKEDFNNSLDPQTDPSQFDVEGISTDVTIETINKVKDWAVKLNEFEEFLNNPSESSLHRILSDNDRAGSLLRGITRKASDSITRIAGEIAKLKEVLNTFVNTAPKKMRDTEQLKLGS
jgi:hypothetical protein